MRNLVMHIMVIHSQRPLWRDSLFLLTVLMLSNNCFSQTPSQDTVKTDVKGIFLKDTWVTNHILGLDTAIQVYKLTRYTPKGKFAGNITQFSDSLNFQCNYTAWCGNDYFTNVSGKYKFIDKDKIAITVDTVSYRGMWDKPTELRETNYLTFTVSIHGDTIVLTRQK
ncbi:MAG: hypothetical protein ACK4ND_17045 [Cytophagaceae bacterium]